MARVSLHLSFLFAALCVTIHCFQQQQADAQVTFSRDWEAGKRAAGSDCFVTFKSAAAVCQMFLNQMRSMMNCEVQHLSTMLKHRSSEDIENF